MPPIRSRRIYFFAELSITHEDPSKINQSIVVKFGYLKTSHIGIGERRRWRQTARRLDRASEPWFFPGHPSNALRHGRYLGLKMARFRVERWAYARPWLRCDWTSLSYREENSMYSFPPPSSFPPYRERVQRVNIRTYFHAPQRLLCILSMFTNSLLSAAWDVFFWVFSGTTWRTEKDSPFYVTATKPSLVLN